jgi:type IV pilus assembly protein PilY1
MSNIPSRYLPHSRPLTATLLLALAAGFSAPFIALPLAQAATTPPAGTVELSPTPVDATQSVPPNIMVTFDDSGSMSATRMGDTPPYGTSSDWSGGPWRCGNVIDPDHPTASDAALRALAMNGVYYNPTITYTPPHYADSTSFPNADSTLKAVWVDGIAVNRPLNPASKTGTVDYWNNPDLDEPFASARTNLMGTATFPNITTKYVSFGSCDANADGGSCKSNSAAKYTSGTNKNKYYYSYKNATGSTGSGTNAVYYGTNLQTGTSSGWTQVVGTTTTTKYNTWTVTTVNTSGTPTTDNRWKCGTWGTGADGTKANGTGGLGGDWWTAASPMDGASHTLSDGTVVAYPNGGPYYYRLKMGVSVALDSNGNPTNTGCSSANCDGLHTLYNASNWEAVPVTDTQNFANWYAYYRTRNLMARSAMSRVFGSSSLAATTADGGYGSTIRAAWQNLNDSNFKLPSTAIISSLIDTSACTDNGTTDPKTTQRKGATQTAPDCYRTAFFNWIFQTAASGSTPTRGALDRAGKFFTRGNGNTGSSGDLTDPYWQPPASGTGDGYELACRQNFHMVVTDGLWNVDGTLPSVSSLTQPVSGTTLPDGVKFPDTGSNSVTSIYAPQHDSSGAASLSDLAFHYWATNLRDDLYQGGPTHPDPTKIVSPYLPDQTTSVFNLSTLSGSGLKATNINQEIYFNPKNDPATWPHMSEYLIGLGVSGVLNYSENTDCTDKTGIEQDACDLRKGNTNSDGIVGWPTPNGSGSGIAANIDDTWHAALAGRGQFFSAGSPQQLVDQLSSILSNIAARTANPTTGAVNASVSSAGALAFNIGYSTTDWSGVLEAHQLKSDGSIDSTVRWSANFPAAASRKILTVSKAGSGTGMAFESSSTFDSVETTGLGPATPSGTDTQANRIAYLRGDQSLEVGQTNGIYRTRNSLLGAIINSQPLYVSRATGGYLNTWPANSPEIASGAQSYSDFVSSVQNRAGTLYIGANDGMLHAFNAPAPVCTTKDKDGNCTAYDFGTNPGQEDWAFIPRAAYGHLGNLTSANFTYAPTVDASPVSRDVFFPDDTSGGRTGNWHTILVGGVGLGGRGVYALDITDPTALDETSAGVKKVLWEFDSDSPVTTGCVSNIGNCQSSDLGYTFGTPNIGRLQLSNGKWVVLVSNGYFPDCSQGDKPSPCSSADAPKDGTTKNPYSSLFVLDAETGAMIAELKTPNTIASYGLATPVLGDYDNDQVDDVAFAGDLQGNLWRFDLKNATDPTQWKVSLVYQGATDSNGIGTQPITVMPRLFPDPTTNRFIVVFGTGKYLGAGDNTSTSAATQSVYGIRDEDDGSGGAKTVSKTNLVAQTLSETVDTDSNSPTYGITLRSLTNNDVPATKDGWYFDLKTTTSGGTVTDAGERVVVTAAAIFTTNTAIISTLIPGSSDPCNPSAKGAVMSIDATTGGAGSGQSSLGGYPYVGGRVDNVRTSGSLPAVSSLGGGTLPIPGLTYSGSSKQVTLDAPMWRRRSWQEIEVE